MSLEVKGQYGLLFPSCLLITVVQQPGTSSLPSLLKCSSEGVIWMCSACVLHQYLLFSAMVHHCGLHPVDNGWWFPTYIYAPLQPISMSSPSGTGIPVFLLFRLQSPSGIPNVDLGGHNCRGYDIDIPHWITYPKVMYP